MRLLVGQKQNVNYDDFQQTVLKHGGKSLGKLRKLNVHIVEAPEQAADGLRKHPHVEFVEVDELVDVSATGPDPKLYKEWHLTQIKAQQVWGSTTGAGVTVAIVDTGVQSSHPDLTANMVAGWNFYANTASTSDQRGHGTAVAGTVGAVYNNAVGCAGVAGSVKLMPCKVDDGTGLGYWSAMASALTYAVDHGCKVANISYAVTQSSAVQSAARYMYNKGGVICIAAGNNGIAETFAPVTEIITVAATDHNDARCSWSSYGPFVDVYAPGIDIYTTSKTSTYGTWWGTSFASPVVAGVAALLLSVKPTLTPAQVLTALKTNPGRVDAYAALQAIA